MRSKDKDKAVKLLSAGKYRQAGALLTKLLEKNPGDHRLWVRLGDAERKLGNKEAAVAAYTKAAEGFTKAGFLVQAISCLKQVVELVPDDDEAHAGLEELYSMRGLTYARPDEKDGSASEREVVSSGEREVKHAASPGGEHDAPLDEAAEDHESDIPVLGVLEAGELKTFLAALKRVKYVRGDTIVKKGDSGESMFFIASGRVAVESGPGTRLAELGEGDFFGEFALLASHERQASVIALEDTEVLELHRNHFDELVSLHPEVGDRVREVYRRRAQANLEKTCDLFRSLAEEDRSAAIDLGTQRVFLEGTPILREGMRGESVFVISDGKAEVSTSFAEERMKLAELGPGDFFGEVSALSGSPCTADIFALTRVDAVVFEGKGLADLLDRFPQVKLVLQFQGKRRIRGTVKLLENSLGKGMES